MTPADFRTWSFAKVLLVSLAWVAFGVALHVMWIFIQFLRSQSAGSGIGGVTFSLVYLFVVLFGPPLILLGSWIAMKLSKRPSTNRLGDRHDGP